MLTCEETRARLPDLAAGEPVAAEVREHVAACEPCRAERDAFAARVERLREGLATLSPSPFLEDAVVRAAGEPPHAEARTSRRVWLGAGLALAAASLVFGVVAGLRAGLLGGGAGAEEPRIAVVAPPRTAEVAAARAKTPVTASEEAGVLVHEASGRRERSRVFLSPFPGTVHRWVHGDEAGKPGRRTLAMGWPPRDGVMLLGNGVLGRLGSAVMSSGDDGAIEVRIGERTWKGLPGTSEAELVVAAPYEGGPEARVRVLVSTGYGGDLLLEEPLARALDLQHFEIPGGFGIPGGSALGGGPIEGQRARARVRIAELGFDEVVEVQVRAPDPRGDAASYGVRAEGLLGVGLLDKRAFPVAHDARTEFRFESRGASVADAGFFGAVVQYAPMSAASFVLAQPLPAPPDATERSYEVARLRIPGGAPPGALVVLSRVWRGRHAVPSREGAIVSVAETDGSLDLPRIAGEAGSTLRMLVIPREGEPWFRDVDVGAARTFAIEVRLAPRAVEVREADAPPGAAGASGQSWSLPEGFGPRTRFVFDDELPALLRRMVGEAGAARPAGAPEASLRVVADAEVPWEAVQRTLMAGVRARIRSVSFALASGGEPIRQDLPQDRGLDKVQQPEPPRLRVRLFGGAPGQGTLVRLTDRGEGMPLETLAEALAAARKETPAAEGVIDVPPPGNAAVPYGDVLRVLRAMRDAGIADVQFTGPGP